MPGPGSSIARAFLYAGIPLLTDGEYNMPMTNFACACLLCFICVSAGATQQNRYQCDRPEFNPKGVRPSAPKAVDTRAIAKAENAYEDAYEEFGRKRNMFPPVPPPGYVGNSYLMSRDAASDRAELAYRKTPAGRAAYLSMQALEKSLRSDRATFYIWSEWQLEFTSIINRGNNTLYVDKDRVVASLERRGPNNFRLQKLNEDCQPDLVTRFDTLKFKDGGDSVSYELTPEFCSQINPVKLGPPDQKVLDSTHASLSPPRPPSLAAWKKDVTESCRLFPSGMEPAAMEPPPINGAIK